MSISYEQITAVNQNLPRMDIKGKNYSMVSARIQGFRSLFPTGTITTDIIQMNEDMVVMKATVMDEEGRVLATGTAFEEKGASFINRTSYLENAETSAVGRALGFLGIGSEEQMCSADELANALKNQNSSGREDAQVRAEIMRIVSKYPDRDLSRKICERYLVGSVTELSVSDAKKCLRDLKKTVKDYEAA